MDILIIVGVVVIALILIVMTGYVKSPSDTAYIISGLKKEPMKDFCLRVSNEANNIDGKIINISYPSEDLAIIVYKNKIKE